VRFFADENMPGAVVKALRDAGHDVAWARRDCPGAADAEVLALAVIEARVLLTFDKDFGELAYRQAQSAECGVILFRFAMSSAADAAERVAEVLSKRDDWPGHFSVVDERRVRMRPLVTR
jgi:predicted nuclease of predicted toxin-antitoxin system